MKQIFDLNLYKEGLRKLRTFGIITTIVLTLISVESVSAIITDIKTYGDLTYERGLSLIDFNGALPLLYCIVAPFMVLSVFGFNFKRSAGDFYFAIPKKRSSIFVSLFISVISWVVLAAIISSVISFAIALGSITINWGESLLYLLQIIVTSLSVTAATMLAVSVTGTGISAVVTALMIMFLPQIVLLVVSDTAITSLNFMSYETVLPVFNPNNNLIVGGTVPLWLEDYTSPTLTAFIYTLVLGGLYFWLGCRMFCRRKAEAAGEAVANPRIRGIIRIAISSLVALTATVSCFVTTYSEGYSGSIIFSIAFSFLIYCVYELICTKSTKKMTEAVPGFAFVIGVQVVLYLLMVLFRTSLINYKPTKQQIDSVTIYPDFGYYYADYEPQDFAVVTKDDKVKELVSRVLKENIENPHNYDCECERCFSSCVWSVDIKDNGQIHKRELTVNSKDNDVLLAVISASSKYREKYKHLPNANDSIIQELYISNGFDTTNLNHENEEILYEMYRSEIQKGNVDYELLAKCEQGMSEYKCEQGVGDYKSVFNINIDYVRGRSLLSYSLAVGYESEEIVKTYLEMTSKGNPKRAKEAIAYNEKSGEEYEHIIECLGKNGSYPVNKYTIEILKQAETKDISYDGNIVEVPYYDKDENYMSAYFNLTDEQLKSLEKHKN